MCGLWVRRGPAYRVPRCPVCRVVACVGTMCMVGACVHRCIVSCRMLLCAFVQVMPVHRAM